MDGRHVTTQEDSYAVQAMFSIGSTIKRRSETAVHVASVACTKVSVHLDDHQRMS